MSDPHETVKDLMQALMDAVENAKAVRAAKWAAEDACPNCGGNGSRPWFDGKTYTTRPCGCTEGEG